MFGITIVQLHARLSIPHPPSTSSPWIHVPSSIDGYLGSQIKPPTMPIKTYSANISCWPSFGALLLLDSPPWGALSWSSLSDVHLLLLAQPGRLLAYLPCHSHDHEYDGKRQGPNCSPPPRTICWQIIRSKLYCTSPLYLLGDIKSLGLYFEAIYELE